jgi:hypothetical protein
MGCPSFILTQSLDFFDGTRVFSCSGYPGSCYSDSTPSPARGGRIIELAYPAWVGLVCEWVLQKAFVLLFPTMLAKRAPFFWGILWPLVEGDAK